MSWILRSVIGLRVIAGGYDYLHVKVLKKGFPNLGYEFGDSVQHDILRESEVLKYIIEEGFCKGCGHLGPDSGRSVRKSIARWDQGWLGTARGSRRRTKLWLNFAKSPKDKAKCNYCDKLLCCKAGVTSNMAKHLQLVHRIELQVSVCVAHPE